MMTSIQIAELPARLEEALAQASAGGEVVLLEGETPKARLVPLVPRSVRVPGLHVGALQPAADCDALLPDET